MCATAEDGFAALTCSWDSFREVILVVSNTGAKEAGSDDDREPYQSRLIDSLLALFLYSKRFLGQVFLGCVGR